MRQGQASTVRVLKKRGLVFSYKPNAFTTKVGITDAGREVLRGL